MNLPIDITSEPGIGLSEAVRLFPAFNAGKSTHRSTVNRWIQEGIRTPDGRVVKLAAIRIGARFVTSRRAILEFIQAQQTPTTSADIEGGHAAR